MTGQGKALAGLLIAGMLAGCGGGKQDEEDPLNHSDLDCLARAMYFESHRSSREGMIAVGTVVMNRVESPDFPSTICGVVAQKNQFATGIMTREMNDRGLPLVMEAAGSVLRGERDPRVQNARFFHLASYRAGYNNMHYTVTAGGNAFYEKRRPELVTQPSPLPPVDG